MQSQRKIYVPDTCVIIDGILVDMIEKDELKDCIIVLPKVVISELENQANKGREIGLVGLEELEKLRELAPKKNIEILIHGELPSLEDLRMAKFGRIDALIREIAKQHNAILITSDVIQAKVAKISGLSVIYKPKVVEDEEPWVFDYFKKYPNMMSLHIKENCPIYGKIGRPGDWRLRIIDEKRPTDTEINSIITSIIEYTKKSKKGYIEIERKGAMVIQLFSYRIAIALPPFAEAPEITIVRPVVKKSLGDYKLPDKVIERLKTNAHGILIAGAPGSGKTTFCQALAEFYLGLKKVVKTIESPRDLQVSDEITQYSPLEGSVELTGDFILLVRPDYTIYDEVRKPRDFKAFIDLRLAGIGMIGVIHANRPIDAIQRFLGKTELGLIPQVIDTVIFIDRGEPRKIYELLMTVKVPYGMKDKDLARPVIEVRDFMTKALEYEIYTFGEEVVTVPIKKTKKENRLEALIKEKIIESLDVPISKSLVRVEFDGQRVSLYVPEYYVPYVIGKNGRMIEALEAKIGLPIDVKELKDLEHDREITDFEVKKTSKKVNIRVLDPEIAPGELVEVYVDDSPVGIFKLNKKKKISITNKYEFFNDIKNSKNIKLFRIKS